MVSTRSLSNGASPKPSSKRKSPISSRPSVKRPNSVMTNGNTNGKASISSSKAFLDAIKNRRSIYGVDKSSPIPDSRIEEIVHEAILHVPSTFNSQSTRILLLLNDQHELFWSLVKESLRPLVPDQAQMEKTSKKMDSFGSAHGTILFFEDQETVKEFEEKFALYADRFQSWSEHTSAMHQLVLWTALEAEGFGANLQHYNPVVDESVQKTWDVPQNWVLKAQIVFGGVPEGVKPAEKTFKPVEGERLRVFGKR